MMGTQYMRNSLIDLPLVKNVPTSPVAVGTTHLPQPIELFLLLRPSLHLSDRKVLINGDPHAGPEVLAATESLVLAGHIRAPDKDRSRSGPVRIGAPQPDS